MTSSLLAILALLAAFLSTPQPVAQPAAAIDAALTARLEALTPDNPEAYFLLAEEVADASPDDAARLKLASTLFILAFELDRASGQPTHLSASALIGLAGIERLARDRRWLQAVAGAFDRRYALQDWSVAASASISDELAYTAASVLGLARSGDGREARKWFERPGVADTLRRYERLIGNTGQTGALSRLDKYMSAWPCPECGNERTVRRPGPRGTEPRICPTCRGNPGPTLSQEELISQLRFEAALLSGIQRSWAAQIIVDQSAPLRDPDADEVAATYRVDPKRPYFRAGQWTDKP